MSALLAVRTRVHEQRWNVAAATVAVFAAYQALILATLVVGLGGAPNYTRLYPAWDNARRIVRLTPSARDAAVLIGREPIFEYGRRHPVFGVAVWSFELTWWSLLFFLSFSTLMGLYLGIGGLAGRWGAAGSLSGAGLVGLVGASVSSLTHCGLGSFGVLLAVSGVSATTLHWFGTLEPVLICAGYALIVLAIVARARARLGVVGGSAVKTTAAALACLALMSGCSRGRGETIPTFALVDQAGAVLRSESLKGRAVVVSFVFTTCAEACPLITAQLARTQTRVRSEKLDDRVRFVSITLDPTTDRPDVLRRYADAYGIDLASWHFLTGAADDVARVVRAFGLSAVVRERVTHGSLVVLVDRQGRIAERRTDLELDPDRLLASLRKLIG
jgi:cytochrome oxidase Cu insertion factor (SCO1/SenC/PrrC family)